MSVCMCVCAHACGVCVGLFWCVCASTPKWQNMWQHQVNDRFWHSGKTELTGCEMGPEDQLRRILGVRERFWQPSFWSVASFSVLILVLKVPCLVAYHLAPAITDFILDEDRECCNNELEQTLTLQIEPSRQSSTHHLLRPHVQAWLSWSERGTVNP